MTKREYKHIVKEALRNEYGFSPKESEIQLMETNDVGTYIAFLVNDRYYRFDSYQLHVDGMTTVWVGSGTIEKVPEKDRIYRE